MYSKTYTLGEFRDRILQLLERYSSNGTVIVSGERADIENRLVTSLNIHLTRLMYEFPDNTRKASVVPFMPECAAVIGGVRLSAQEEKSYDVIGNDIAYYMEASGRGRLEISFGGEKMTRDIFTDGGGYTVIRGTVGNGLADKCTFTLCGESFLDVKNFAVYRGVPTGMVDEELICGPGYCSAYLPSDCAQVLSVNFGNDTRSYKSDFSVLEKERMILVESKAARGTVLEYVPYAPQFSESEGDASAVDISPVMADALGYMCAADLCPVNQPELYSRLTYKYREILGNIYSRHRKNGMINRFYGVFGKRYRVKRGGELYNGT
ncbi:MAG: hypothetical protein E7583_00700 [Ruminococcaceae bacterium]|nr:hypothetical protein [Oscillospiraceae bacterium]